MSNNNSFPDHTDVIPKLKFIARLNKGDKINVKNMFVQQNNFVQRLSRSFFNIDDRSNTLLFVTETVNHGFDLFHQYIQSHEPFCQIQARNVLNDIRATKKGLVNLKETYSDDIMFTCKIDALIEESDAKLDEITEVFYKNEKVEKPLVNPIEKSKK